MATTHSSILAWKIPWTEETGRLPFTESQRVGHDWVIGMHACLYKNRWRLDCTRARLHRSSVLQPPLIFWHTDLDSFASFSLLEEWLEEWNYEKKTPTSSSCLVFCRICLFKEMTFRRCSWEVPNFSGLSSADSSDCCGKQTEEPKDLITPLKWAN